jgi:spore coat protein CotH
MVLALHVLAFNKFYVHGQQTHHWETIFYSDTTFKYHTSNQGAPHSDWRKVDYNDQAWLSGKGGIGYGDNDDSTIVSNCISVCLRRSFFTKDKSTITDAVLSIDYDDAFVAYLNDVEVARSDGLIDVFPAYTVLSSANHEALMYRGEKPEDFIIPREKLMDIIQTGNNVLAVQVHNASEASSDLSSLIFLSVGLSIPGKQYLKTPNWFTPPIILDSSNLPIFIIDTYGKAIVDEPKTNAHLKVVYNGEGMRNSITDEVYHYNGNIGIELRGNSTMSFPKKPYTFETRTETGENLNVPLLGFPDENDWILRASYYDRTFIRNPLAHHMSKLMGHWSSGNKHCEVVVNGEYQGLYVLVEKIKRTKNRLNLNKLNPEEIFGEDITGGYIYEVAGQHNDFGYNRRLRYPKLNEIAPEQLAYIRGYDDSFRTEAYKDFSDDPMSFYEKWIDLQSFVDFVLIQEFTRNPDGIGWSGYFHKDKNKPLCAGPVWDFDQSLGNSTFSEGIRSDGWIIDYEEYPNPPFWKVFLHEPYFISQMKKRWEAIRKTHFSSENVLNVIDSIAANVSESVERNFQLWPTLNSKIWREVEGYNQRDTYQKHVDYLKSYVSNRLVWIDGEMAKTKPNTSIVERYEANEILAYPNPANGHIYVKFLLYHPECISINIFNNLGVLVKKQISTHLQAGSNTLKITFGTDLPRGVYVIQLLGSKTLFDSIRFVISE